MLTWRNGRRVRLRTVWGNPWRFDSSREHARPFAMRRLNEIVSATSEFRQADSAGKFQETAWAAELCQFAAHFAP